MPRRISTILLLVMFIAGCAAAPKTDRADDRRSTPHRSIDSFMTAWRDQDWQRMAGMCDRSWVSRQADAGATLRTWFGSRVLQSSTIVETTEVDATTTDVTVQVHYVAAAREVDQRLVLRVVREDDQGRPSVEGDWGVSPASALSVEKNQ
jgi:PBP1b-binding outer membrane lipoprotein LpoB